MEKKDINEQYRCKLIETFTAFEKFCKRSGIKYYAAYGTLIGTIRHKGLIPWDDDIDVYMLREDYDKFCFLRGTVEGHYDIMDINDKGYWLLSLAKFVDTETTLWEFKRLPLILGVYIDVFPLDECNKEQVTMLKNEYDKYSSLVTQSLMRYSFGDLLKAFAKCSFKHLLSQLTCICYKKYRYSYYMKKYLSCVDKIKNQKGDYLVAYDGPYGEGEVCEKSWFSNTIKMPFESVNIDVPLGYDKCLKQLYGNYMEFPPEKERISHHSHYFLDLEHRLTIDEICNRFH